MGERQAAGWALADEALHQRLCAVIPAHGHRLPSARIHIPTPGASAGHSHRLRIGGPPSEATCEARSGTDTASRIRPTAAAAIRALRELDQPIVVG